jgi:hypothetical protein
MNLKRILYILKKQLQFFFLNEFWRNFVNLGLIFLSLVSNAAFWYFGLTKFKNLIEWPIFFYAGGVLLLNIVLAVISYKKFPLASYSLLGCMLIVQFFLLILLRFIVISKSY